MKQTVSRASRAALLALASILALIPIAGRAQVPQTISYQGSLSDAKGTPVNATVEMVLRLYGSPTATTALWGEGQNVAVQNGTFSVVLGGNELNPLAPDMFQEPLWLGIAVNADAEMKPRQALTAVGYAFRAKTVERDTLSALGCGPGRIAKWNGGAWACAADDVSGGTAANLVCATCVSTGELAFDTATQPELDGHGATAGAHHSRYTDAEAVAAAGPHVTSVEGLSGGAINGSVAVNGGLLLAGQLTSTLATGAPLSVASSDLVANLNADQLDGLQAAEIVAAAQDEVRTPITSLPFMISVPGSYYLTGDLTLASTTSHGIFVGANDVTIDLMGFSLIGPGADAYGGIIRAGISVDRRGNVEIRNGTVRGFALGISEEFDSFARGQRVINMRLKANAYFGLSLTGFGHTVKDSTAVGNGSTGFVVGIGAVVTGNTAVHNEAGGFEVGGGSLVTHNIALGNGALGIGAYDVSTVTANTVWGNNQSDWPDQGGIRVSRNSVVKGNTLNGNLRNNIIVAHGGNAVEENLVTGSTNGINFLSTGNFFANNRASGNTANYVNAAGQTDGGGNVSF